jgi:hypothetical protein
MGFRDDNDSAKFDVVRINRATGERKVLQEREAIEGRWKADSVLKRMLESNRDPSVTFEVQAAGGSQKKFRAAAFGDATERLSAFKDPFES